MDLNQRAALEAASRFFSDQEILGVEPLGRGLIHETWACRVSQSGSTRRFVLQKFNRSVFPDPDKVMGNIERVTSHIRRRVDEEGESARGELTLELIPHRQGEPLYRDGDGSLWRSYVFLEGTETQQEISSVSYASATAAAFAHFQRRLADLPAPPLHETIPGFHDTPGRLRAFRETLRQDGLTRARDCRGEIATLLELAHLAESLESTTCPLRVVHNDTKINNVLFRAGEPVAVAVIDLDTVMPGLVAHDFGDLVRSSMAGLGDVEPEGRNAAIDLVLFEALADGFLSEASSFLLPEERGQLLDAPAVMTYELALRFLTDHLEGDVYFRANRPGANLARARFQIDLLHAFEAVRPNLSAILDRLKTAYPCG